MASLLDFVVAQRNPRLAGLLGVSGQGEGPTPGQAAPARTAAPAASQAVSGPQGLSGALGQLFGGFQDPNLTPAENARARQQAMIQGGLASFGSDKRGLARLADAALVGQQFGQQTRNQMVQRKIDLQELAIEQAEFQQEQERQARREHIFANTDMSDPAQRTEAMGAVLAAGDFDAAQRINDFEKAMPEPELVDAGDSQIIWDPRSLEVKGEIETPEEFPEGTQMVNLGTRSQLVDKATGEVIATFNHTLSPSELRDRQDTVFDQTNALADDFRSETGNLQESLLLAEQARGAPAGDPAAQQTLVIALNKLLDPGSVVRQSEFARVQEVGGFQAEAQTFANRLMEQGQLPPEVEEMLRNEIARLEQENRRQLGDIATQFAERANAFGLNPDFIIRRGLQQDLELNLGGGGDRSSREESQENIFLGGGR